MNPEQEKQTPRPCNQGLWAFAVWLAVVGGSCWWFGFADRDRSGGPEMRREMEGLRKAVAEFHQTNAELHKTLAGVKP